MGEENSAQSAFTTTTRPDVNTSAATAMLSLRRCLHHGKAGITSKTVAVLQQAAPIERWPAPLAGLQPQR